MYSVITEPLHVTLLLAYLLHGNERSDVQYLSSVIRLLFCSLASLMVITRSLRKQGCCEGVFTVHCSLTIPSVLLTSIYQTRLYRFQHGLIINNIDTKAKCRHLQKLSVNGLCKLLPLSPSLWFSSPPPFLVWISTVCVLHTAVCKGGGGQWGSGPQTAKHLPRSPFTGHFFLFQHFALPSMSIIFLRISESYIGFFQSLLGPGEMQYALFIAAYQRHIRTTMYRQGGVGSKTWFYINLVEIRAL
jgi:hypothetical protein